MATDRAGFDSNGVHSLTAVSNDGLYTPVVLWADPTTHALVTSGGGSGGGGGAVTVADGADVTQGALADTAVTAGGTGSVSGKLRTISADLSLIKANQTNATQKTQLVDGSGNVIASTGNALNVNIASGNPSSVVSTNNSTASTLLSGAVFTGTGEDVSAYSEMRVSVFANIASATDGLSLQQSSDNTNWDVVDTYTVAAATAGQGKTYVVPRQEKFFRAVYTNGGTNQTTFRLQTILNRTGTAPSSQRAGDAYTNETDLVQGQSFLMGFNGTTWDRLRTTGTGVLTVSAVVTGTAAVTQSGTWNVGSSTATGSAVPANAFYHGISDGTNLRGVLGAANALNSTGAGVPTAQIVGQFDDVSPTSITENQFGNIRMSANRNVYVTLRDAAGNERGLNIDASNRMNVRQQSPTSALTSVAGSATSVTLLASNTARTSAAIYNDSTAILYIALTSSAASATAYTVQVPASGYYEVLGGYTGQINGIWASATGNARITELS